MADVWLRIKKIYFEDIKYGRKQIEYRSTTAFYKKMFDRDGITHAIIHYQGTEKMRVPIVRVRKIRRPRALETSGIEFTSTVFEITLGEPVQI